LASIEVIFGRHNGGVRAMIMGTDFISGCLKEVGFEKIETIEREPDPGVEYESRRAYVFAEKT
jgi:hypothetical protein